MESESTHNWREIVVPETAAGMRVDRFLALRFADRSRNWIARGIRRGQVTDHTDRALRASATLKGGERLRLRLDGIAPTEPPPPFPEILHEDERVVVVNKPSGLLCHPAGAQFTWALIGLAKARWPSHRVDLVHRLDKDTSGVLVLTKDLDANRAIKAHFQAGEAEKIYDAFCRGKVSWAQQELRGPIGLADGPIRIQMAVTPDGLAAHTSVERVALHPTRDMTWVRCRLHTGRTHQIRVHLHHAGHSLVGDLMYGLPPEIWLSLWEQGPSPELYEAAGAARQALHASAVTFDHPDGGRITVTAPLPEDMRSWWDSPAPEPSV